MKIIQQMMNQKHFYEVELQKKELSPERRKWLKEKLEEVEKSLRELISPIH